MIKVYVKKNQNKLVVIIKVFSFVILKWNLAFANIDNKMYSLACIKKTYVR